MFIRFIQILYTKFTYSANNRAAKNAGASHLSADGLRIYTVRYGETLEAEWKEWLRDFGAWSVVKEMPLDAVKM